MGLLKVFPLLFHFQHVLAVELSAQHKLNGVQAINSQIYTEKINQKALYDLFAAYLHTKPLEELLERVERERRDAQLRILIWSLVRE
ncbi:MAG: hypothetical protein ABSB81_10240 [Halobacteriota archaeon]|jgi:hypothetical protein